MYFCIDFILDKIKKPCPWAILKPNYKNNSGFHSRSGSRSSLRRTEPQINPTSCDPKPMFMQTDGLTNTHDHNTLTPGGGDGGFENENTCPNNFFYVAFRGHSGRVVTLSPPTSEAGVRSPTRPQVGKLVVACRWSAVYSTEP